MSAGEIRAIADPASDLDYPLKGPFEASRSEPPESAAAAVRLAKLAGLLPAALLFPIPDKAHEKIQIEGALSEVLASDILGFESRAAQSLQLVVRASVPLEGAEESELAAFRPSDGGPEHYAVIIGAKRAPALAPPGPVLTRLHSECFTGDLLGSLKCDCGDQLRGAVQTIAKAGGGVLLYLAQEGRGIGLMNKLRAYRLQDEGFDTMQANQRLGFEADERLYDIAARILQLLGYSKVRLLTNNPDKVRALQTAGIEVVERVPHSFPDNEHNRDYLRVKAEKGGHLL
jgi:GTP cyclohydrolase II